MTDKFTKLLKVTVFIFIMLMPEVEVVSIEIEVRMVHSGPPSLISNDDELLAVCGFLLQSLVQHTLSLTYDERDVISSFHQR